MPASSVILPFLLLFTFPAFSYEAPKQFLSGSSGFMAIGLNSGCYALDITTDTLSCNPAFIAKEKEARFNTSIFSLVWKYELVSFNFHTTFCFRMSKGAKELDSGGSE